MVFYQVFLVMKCECSSIISWPLTLLLDTPHRTIPNHLGVITPAHQLIVPGLLSLQFWLVSGHLGETSILCLRSPPWTIVLATTPHLSVLPLLTVQPVLHLPTQPGLPCLLIPVGLLLVDCLSLLTRHSIPHSHCGSSAHSAPFGNPRRSCRFRSSQLVFFKKDEGRLSVKWCSCCDSSWCSASWHSLSHLRLPWSSSHTNYC